MAGVFGLVFNESKSQILLVKRRDMPIWVLPGGKVESGETLEDAAIREVFEETGYRVKIITKVGEYKYPGKDTVNSSFICGIEGGSATLSNESKEIAYFQISKLPDMISPFVSPMITDALNYNGTLFSREFAKFPKGFWLKALGHPFALFKWLLTKMGLHWNKY